MKKTLTLKLKLFIAFLLIAILPLLVAFQIINIEVTSNYSARILEESEAVAKNTKQIVEEAIFQQLQLAQTIASDSSVTGFILPEGLERQSDRQIYQILNNYLSANNGNIQIHVLGLNGSKYSTGHPPNLYNLQTYGSYGIFEQATHNPSRPALFSNYYTGSDGDRYPLSVIQTVFVPGGKTVGYVVIDISRDYLLALLNSNHATHTSSIALYTNSGLTVIDSSSMGSEGLFSSVELDILRLSGQGGTIGQVLSDDRMQVAVGMESVGLVLVTHSSTAQVTALINRIKALISVILMVTAVLALAYSWGTTHAVLRPIEKLLAVIEKTAGGDLSERFAVLESYSPEFVTLGNSYNGMLDQINRLMSNVVEKQRSLNLAEMQALQGQIKPHFYYNFLNEIKSLAKLNRNDDIVRMVLAFGTLLRANMSIDDDLITVDEEMRLLESYLAMHSIRQDYEEDVRISVDPEIRRCRIPKLLLQPIVENAVVHGMDGAKKGVIQLNAFAQGADLVFEVIDNGPGIANPTELLNATEGGLGLRNVDRRLKLYFGEVYGLKIESTPREQTKVTVTVQRIEQI